MSDPICSHCGDVATQEVSSSEFGKRWFCDEHGSLAVEELAGREIMWSPYPRFKQPEPEPEPEDTEEETS